MSRFLTISFLSLLGLSSASLLASPKLPSENPFRSKLVDKLAKQLNTPEKIKIFFSGNLHGSLDECGCAVYPKGGIERTYNFLAKEGLVEGKQPENTLLVDYGNMLFKSKSLFSEKHAVAEGLKFVEATNHLSYAAVNFGNFERNVSPEKLMQVISQAKFPIVSTNFIPPKEFEKYIQRRIPIKLKDANLMIYGLSVDDSESPYGATEGWKILDYKFALTEELKTLPKDFFPVVLNDLNKTELNELESSLNRPVVFIGLSQVEALKRAIQKEHLVGVNVDQEGKEIGVFEFSPSPRKSGWFSPEDSVGIAKAWDKVATELKDTKTLKKDRQKTKVLEARVDILTKMSPRENSLGYNYRAYTVGENYNGKNELSKYQTKKTVN
jgi:hypothetical protein